MRKFSALTVAIIITVVAFFVVGGTFAYFFSSTSNIVNTFVPGVVECQVEETFANNVKSDIQVKNIGTTSAYMRVCLTTYWVENYTDENNNPATRVVGRNAELSDFTLATGWILGSDGFYYYTKPIAPKALTPDMLADGSTITLQTDGNFSQYVEVFAEAIQSAPDDAVLDAWGTAKGNSVTGVSGGVLTVTPAS